MESIDLEILRLLEHDARLNCRQLATMLDVPEGKIKERVGYLETYKLILGYEAVVDWDKACQDKVTAMIDVKVSPEREVGFDRIADRISRFPEVRCVYLMSGTYDLSVLVQGDNMKDVSRFVSQKLSSLESVQSTTTHFLLKRYKQEGFIFGSAEDDRRLVIQL
jgi:DNA-binding Lrp family transcriptional regulator